MVLYGEDDFAISRSLILFRYFFQALQKRRINVNRKTLCLHTGSIPLFYLYVKWQWGRSHPSPSNGEGLPAPVISQAFVGAAVKEA